MWGTLQIVIVLAPSTGRGSGDVLSAVEDCVGAASSLGGVIAHPAYDSYPALRQYFIP